MKNDIPDERRKYVVNPLATAFNDDKYYLLCYDDKHLTLTQYRIDRMDSVKMLEEKITQHPTIDGKNIAKNRHSLFEMYSGEKQEVCFEASTSVLDAIYDRFGDRVQVLPYGDGKALCRVEVQVGRPLLSWFIGFGSSLKVKSPENVIAQIKEMINESMGNYNN